MTPPELAVGDSVFTLDGEHLVLTINPESLTVCRHCPNLHLIILKTASKENIRELVLGLAHFASHLNDD